MKPKLHLQYPKSTLDGTNSFITFRMYDYSSAPNSSGIGNIRSNIQRSAGGNFSSENLKNLPKNRYLTKVTQQEWGRFHYTYLKI